MSTMFDPAAPVTTQKAQIRERMRSLRLIVDQKDGPDAAMAAMRLFLGAMEALGVGAGAVVAGYWPIETEIDPRPTLARLDDRGITCALPVVVRRGKPLEFRAWRPTDPLDHGPYATRHPARGAAVVRPDVLLVPLLAMDGHGHRLGQGAGYYDRTLADLRAAGPVVAIGIGFAIQHVDRVPHEAHDERLDWILTDRTLVRAAP